MSAWYLILLALLQGLTEFLPVSSSAHLILLPRLLSLPDQGLVFDVAANTGTFIAVVSYFRHELGRVGIAVLRLPGSEDRDRRLAGHLLVASIPVLCFGWLFRNQVANLAREPVVIGTASIFFGILLFIAERWGRRERSLEQLDLRGAFVIGLAQALALVPGTSRSGITITAALGVRLRRQDAARFSFLLLAPVSAAAAIYELVSLAGVVPSAALLSQLALVVGVSAVTGFVVIHLFLALLRRHSMTFFVVYRILLGLVLLWPAFGRLP